MSKYNSSVEDDEDEECMPGDRQPLGPSPIRFQSSEPPPANINGPTDQNRIIHVETATPIETGYLISLSRSFAKSRELTPLVIEVECPQDVNEKTCTGDRVSDSGDCKQTPAVPRERKGYGSGNVRPKRQPD